ncbi:hypothetical protein QN277_023889 [Acacia crassicarpa]|uniref:Homeobox-leucine zipper protein n=1 Tax=Acacia crassicarpa TaxID=499986 RepID=A0AAE1K6N5_9FABA|nr:hypothetical protein QN277_023889 [Acacia crassicarpa]
MSVHYSEFSHSAAAEAYNSTTPTSSSSSSPTRTCSIRKKKNSSSKKRFSDDQIKLLESIFETESKLDHTKKLQLASELGLQPRQVAIWFQNRRARSKSKHIQRSYNLLQENYDALASKFEALKKENHALLQELQKLRDLEDRNFCYKKVRDENLMNRECGKAEVKQSSSSMERSEKVLGVLSDDDRSLRTEYFGLEEEEPTILNSQEVWRNLKSTDELLPQSDDSAYQWGDFWS